MKKFPFRFSHLRQIVVFPIAMAATLFVGSCNLDPKSTTSDAVKPNSDLVKTKFTAAMVDNRKDPSCGMPVTAGISDTSHYNGKVFGFCSDECKQAFLKDPVELAKNADLKP
jgi:YHS domain-containing protein